MKNLIHQRYGKPSKEEIKLGISDKELRIGESSKWIEVHPEDKKILIKMVTDPCNARHWCSWIEPTGYSVYLFKKFGFINAEEYDNADDIEKKLILFAKKQNTGWITEIKIRWTSMIRVINSLNDEQFEKYRPLIQRFVEENAVSKYFPTVIRRNTEYKVTRHRDKLLRMVYEAWIS